MKRNLSVAPDETGSDDLADPIPDDEGDVGGNIVDEGGAGPKSRQPASPSGVGANHPAERSGPAEPSDSPEEGQGEEEDLEAARREAAENWDRYLRAEAELDNLRKRSERRLADALALQRRQLVGRFLEVMDNLERALAHGQGDPESLVAGLETTYRELSRILEREGVEQMKVMDEPFDPAIHEAVGAIPLPSGEAERIVAVDRPGYKIDGVLLRPARVLVGQPGDAEAD